MALDADTLEDQILDVLESVSPVLFPNVVKAITVREVPKEDGTMDYEMVEVTGPVEIDKEAMRPLARAVARAVVDHITSHADLTGTGVGTDWRIV